MHKLDLTAIINLLQATWVEVKDHLSDDNHLGSLQAIEAVLPKIDQAYQHSADEAQRAKLTQLYWQWELLRCQHRYFRTHSFTITTFQSGARRSQPAHIPRLFFILQRLTNGPLQLKVIIELALSLLEQSFPKVNSQVYADLSVVLEELNKSHRYAIISGQGDYITALINIIQSTLSDEPVDYGFLTNLYNQITLKNIATHGIVSARFAADHGFCMTSSDSVLTDSISYLRLNLSLLPKNAGDADDIVAQTQEAFSLLHQISLERGRGYKIDKLDRSLLQEVLQQRLHASVVFITDASPANNPYDAAMVQSELRLTTPVPLKNIKAILVPIHQLQQVQQLFPTVQVIPVASTQINLRLTREVMKCLPHSTENAQTLLAPDYEKALLYAIQKLQLSEFMIHLSRLATTYDAEHSLFATYVNANDFFSASEAKMTTRSTRKFIERNLLPEANVVKQTRRHSAEFFDKPEKIQESSASDSLRKSFG